MRGIHSKHNRMKNTLYVGVGTVLLCAAAASYANDADGVRPASLEVKSRIKSMEQVNVTSEKQIDETAPPPSAAVALLLSAVEASEDELTATAKQKKQH